MSGILFDQPSNSYIKSTKNISELPFYFPIHYQHINIVGVVRNYNLSQTQRVFMTFYDSRACLLGVIFRLLYKLAVVINATAYLLSWSRPLMVTPDSCDTPACAYDELCPNKMICIPEIDQVFITIQKICNFLFLFEYLITAATCWSVPARLAGVLDLYFEKNKDNTSLEIFDATEKRNSVSDRKTEAPSLLNITGRLGMRAGEMSWLTSGEIDAAIDDDPIYPPAIQVCRFLTTGKNLRTMTAVFPFFIVLQFHPKYLSSVNIYFTIGRFMTLFKLTDFISSRRSSHIVNNTLLRAYPTLLYMIWTVLIVATLMSSIIFLTERGEFTVNRDFPDGAFLRPDLLHTSREESPFKSVLVSMYYVLVTMTSTGYGDLYCTSGLGRSLSNILMCSAVFILALPIAVLGNILSEEVEKYLKRKEERNNSVKMQLKKGRKLPVYKYRRGPSLVGAKEMVGQTFRRLSSIALYPSSSSYSATASSGGGGGGGAGGGARGARAAAAPTRSFSSKPTLNTEIRKNETFALDSSFPPSPSSPSPSSSAAPSPPPLHKQDSRRRSNGGPQRRGSENGYDRRLSNSTLQKVRRLSATSQIQFIESHETHLPFNSSTSSPSFERQQSSNDNNNNNHTNRDHDDDDVVEGNGIVLNPMNSQQVNRSTSVSKLFQSSFPTDLSSREEHPPAPPPAAAAAAAPGAETENQRSSLPPLHHYHHQHHHSSMSSEVSNISSSQDPSFSYSNAFSSSSPSPSPSSSPFPYPYPFPSMTDIRHQLNDIDKQIEIFSNLYDEQMKQCLETYQQIQIQMRIRNDLLESLTSNCKK